ncbi:alkaline phosphatase D family protein [Streptomyces sp. NBC_01089]|uniref:alkaline phosphatase D family protein n=1 Tax=Streptomyces sp. NBC_01089 TaxID=2903747 RepID=UPI00386F885A|nr:alkaline phosphatase family protein [Streptomyces sp. NBC_01089]
MAGLRLGPLLRYVDWDRGESATIWVEADRPCTVEVRCPDGAGGEARTFRIAGHHYALVPVTGLVPGTETPYGIRVDGEEVWPPPDSPFPPSTIRTPDPGTESDDDPRTGSGGGPGAGSGHPAGAPGLRVSFGSCRWAAPAQGEADPVGPDALDTLAASLAAGPPAERPDILLLLGDQVYADEVSADTRDWLAARRDLREPPGAEVADYEEYTRLYYESWLDPEVRWLLSTVPSCMIFDDHDVIDDWNTSAAWQQEIRATDWWQERILSGLMSYWVHQHLGNLSPAELAADQLYAAVCTAPDGTEALRKFAAEADADPAFTRWSYRRDFGRTRLLMVDSRAARVLDEQHRAMVGPEETQWLRAQLAEGPGSFDHLLIGTSLPWLLPPLIHDAESWDAALCAGVRGARWARFGEKLRRTADLEHWAAFPDSFDELTRLIAETGTGEGAPATICVLSGDVHHAYVAEPHWPSRSAGKPAPDSLVVQLTCSPVHNSIPAYVRFGFRFGWSRTGRLLGRALRRHGRLADPPVGWRRGRDGSGGPWFGNQLMTLDLLGRSSRLRLTQARGDGKGSGNRNESGKGSRLETVLDRELTRD